MRVGDGGRCTLRSRPEWMTIFVLGIGWEYAEEVLDLMVEELLEVEACYFYALVEVG